MGRTHFLPTSLKIVAAVGAAFVLWGLVLALTSSPAHAAGDCSTTAGTTTCTFSSTDAEDTFVVPAGVSSVHVVANGARGASGGFSSGGLGAQVSGDLAVTPGQKLYVEVGGLPRGGSSSGCDFSNLCIGGFNGGGGSSLAGSGGGASDVRTVSRDQSGSLASRLIVAAGGGGSGAAARCKVEPSDILAGGAGGNAESDGGNGQTCGSTAGGTGGKAGTQSAGGAGGSPIGGSGSNGSLGQGGGSSEGGGGGGGLYGGGAGGEMTQDPGSNSGVPSGGGGGGSNLVPTGGTATISSDRLPSIIISYTEPNKAPVNTVPGEQSTNEDTALTFKRRNSCTTTAGTTTCTFSSTGAEDTFVVPEGVSGVHVVATGARGAMAVGAPNPPAGPAGLGARVSGDLAVTPGQKLYVNVGGAPTAGAEGDCFPTVACVGGFNGGGEGFASGGGGGGASDVRTVSRDQSGSLASRLIVAGGGGGSAAGANCAGTQIVGAAGGDAGSDGGNGPTCGPIDGSTGGKAGTQSEGGAGGSPGGQSGTLEQGGNGGGSLSGGGGGGYYGGGGGGAFFVVDGPDGGSAGASGGGGGSNLVPTGGTATISEDPSSVIIRYTEPNQAPVFNSNPISISDVDAGTSPVKVTLAVSHGTLTLGGDTSGLTFAAGSSNGTSNMTFTGTIASINSALSELRFDPDANYNGPAALTITTDDQGNTGSGGAKSDTDTVSITVNSVNDAPVANDGTASGAEDGNPIQINLGTLVNDVETQDANLTYTIVNGPTDQQGTLTADPNTVGVYSFDSAQDFNGFFDILYTVTDRGDPDNCQAASPEPAQGCDATETSLQKKVSVTINAVNDPPTANAQSLTTNEDINKVITLTGDDLDGDTLSYKITSLPTNGKLRQGTTEITSADLPFSLASNQVTYDPNDNYNNTAETADSFDFKVNDRSVDSAAAAKVSITVTPENDAPTVAVAAVGSCGTNDRSGTINLTVNDPDGQTQTGSLTLSATSNNPTLVPASNITFGGTGASRTLTATALSGKTGTATITVTVSDGTATGTVALTLQAGGNSNDTLAGASATDDITDILLGQNGDDTLRGMGGKDLLCGARGNDRLTGGALADHFGGGSGTDTATDFTAGVDTKSSIP